MYACMVVAAVTFFVPWAPAGKQPLHTVVPLLFWALACALFYRRQAGVDRYLRLGQLGGGLAVFGAIAAGGHGSPLALTLFTITSAVAVTVGGYLVVRALVQAGRAPGSQSSAHD